jgi:hypothetical protein
MTKKVQRQLRKERDRDRKRASRRGRHRPQTTSIERQAPWKAEGISRAKWYRQQKVKTRYIEDKVVSPPFAPEWKEKWSTTTSCGLTAPSS